MSRMIQNYDFGFEIIAVIITFIILTDFKRKYIFVRRSTRVFTAIMFVGLAESISDIISSILIARTQYVDVAWNWAAAIIYFALQAVDMLLIFWYVFCVYREYSKARPIEWILILTPSVVMFLIAITSYWNHFLFFFDENKLYHQGMGANFGYFHLAYYVLLTLAYTLRYRLTRKRTNANGILFFCFFYLIVIALQFHHREILLGGISRSIALIILYSGMENPNDYIDLKTKLLNGFAFQEGLKQRIYKNQPFFALSIDLDNFRYLNAGFGYEIGDAIIQDMADVLLKQASVYYRKLDIFRVEKDHFTILFYGTKQEVLDYTAAIKAVYDMPREIAPDMVKNIDITIVVLEYPIHFKDASQFNDLSKLLMQTARSTHEKLLIADRDQVEKNMRKEHVEKVLRDSIREGRLEVYYQPIVDAEGHLSSFEALSRLWDEEGNFIAPDEFIAIAEERFLIIELGNYVFDKTCQFIKKMHENPTITDDVTIHVNVSILQFMQADCADKFIAIADKHQIALQNVSFEVTELAKLDEPEVLLMNMRKLMAAGAGFSLDDFGTGNSNISYVMNFPFTEIKFDKSMTWAFFENEIAQLIMENEFTTLQKLHKKIVVEGIETREQYEAMKKEKIEYYQGYYFDRAISEKECMDKHFS